MKLKLQSLGMISIQSLKPKVSFSHMSCWELMDEIFQGELGLKLHPWITFARRVRLGIFLPFWNRHL